LRAVTRHPSRVGSVRAITRSLMPFPRIHEETASIALAGKFNPAIFQPAWLAAKGLLRESEASAATIEVIHPEVSQFRVEWLHLSVTRERFTATTSDPSHRAPLRDLVAGIFDLLDQTPTTVLGLSRAVHVDLPDEATWHALGHFVAPKEPWGDVLTKPGLRSLLMQGTRDDGLPGRMFFRVEPSLRYTHAAFLDSISEYAADPVRTSDVTSYFMERLAADWDRVAQEALASMEKLLGKLSLKGDK